MKSDGEGGAQAYSEGEKNPAPTAGLGTGTVVAGSKGIPKREGREGVYVRGPEGRGRERTRSETLDISRVIVR